MEITTTLIDGTVIKGLNKIMAYKKPTPQIRPSQESSIAYAIEKIFKVGKISYPYRNCLNCLFWNFDMDGCNKFKQKPPTEVIVYSCEHYEDNDDIPF